jgi:hypothetical protein
MAANTFELFSAACRPLNAFAFDDLDVSIDRQIRELVNLAVGPADFYGINLVPAGTQDLARIV